MSDDGCRIEPNVRVGIVDELESTVVQRSRMLGQPVAGAVFTSTGRGVVVETEVAEGDGEVVPVAYRRIRIDPVAVRRQLELTIRRVLARRPRPG
jgi:hypothetical protein